MPNKYPAPVARQEGQQSADLAVVVKAIDDRTDQFMALLGSPEAVARFRTVALHAVTARPDLLRCQPLTIVEAIREAASLDLEPTGVLGEAWLVPYKGQAKLRIGWRGLLKLIRRSGEIAAVDCQVVYEHDDFEIAYHLTPPFRHIPALKERGGFRGAYAWAKLRTGEFIIEWLPVEDVAPIRKIAAADSLMWESFPGEGMRKSAIRRLSKRLPQSPMLERATIVEGELEEITPQPALPARTAAMAALSARFDQAEEEGPAEQPDDATVARVMGKVGNLNEPAGDDMSTEELDSLIEESER